MTLWLLHCLSCRRPWLATAPAVYRPCPFCGAGLDRIEIVRRRL